MKLRLVRKDPASGDSNCPALYEVLDGDGAPTGAHVVVGRVLDPTVAEFAAGVGSGEVAMYLPEGVLAE